MSWPKGLGASLVIVYIAPGCGFEPLYGKGGAVSEALGQVRIEQIDDRTVFDKHRLEQQQWLGQHVDAAAVAGVIEVGKLLWIWNRGNQTIQLQPLGGEIFTKPA